MLKNLLIVGAGQYGRVARDVAMSLQAYERIEFADDLSELAIYKIDEAKRLSTELYGVFVAIGNPQVREGLVEEFSKLGFLVVRLISPYAWVSDSAAVADGCIVEPMAVVNSEAQLGRSTFICAGAVVNHNATVGDFCHCDCNSTVLARACVPGKTKVLSGTVFS